MAAGHIWAVGHSWLHSAGAFDVVEEVIGNEAVPKRMDRVKDEGTERAW